jgi:hypothetical protein
MVRNLPTKSVSMLGLRATVIHPVVPIEVKKIKHRRRPIQFESIPPKGLRIMQHICIIAAVIGNIFVLISQKKKKNKRLFSKEFQNIGSDPQSLIFGTTIFVGTNL